MLFRSQNTSNYIKKINDTLSANITTIEEDVSTLDTAVSTLQGEVVTNTADIITANAGIIANSTAIVADGVITTANTVAIASCLTNSMVQSGDIGLFYGGLSLSANYNPTHFYDAAWNNNPALYITGVLTANGTIYCLKSSGTAVPSVGVFGGLGDRLVLWQGGTSVYPFSLGVTGVSQWYSVPSGASHNFYINGTNNATISSSGLTTTNITTPQILSTTTNNICCITCTVLPSGTGTSGYWYIDVTSYVGNQKGSIILCNISLNSASYLWTGRIVVQSYSTPAVKLYPDYVTGNLVIATSYHISGICSYLQVSVSGGTYTILSTDNLYYKLIG